MRVENRRFYAEKMGEIVTDRPEENFRELMNYDFTAQMENSLDRGKSRSRVESCTGSFLLGFHPAVR